MTPLVDPNTVLALPDEYARFVLSLLVGVAISSACGFRIFIPPLVMSAGAIFIGTALPEDLALLGTFPAFFILLTATLCEVAAYYIPWVDNLLDHIASPLAMVAGTIITSSFLGADIDPALRWSVALIAGGGAAGAIQSVTTAARGASSLLTLGLTNPIVSSVENVMAFGIPMGSLLFPLVAVIIGGVLLIVVLGLLFRRFRQKKKPA